MHYCQGDETKRKDNSGSSPTMLANFHMKLLKCIERKEESPKHSASSRLLDYEPALDKMQDLIQLLQNVGNDENDAERQGLVKVLSDEKVLQSVFGIIDEQVFRIPLPPKKQDHLEGYDDDYGRDNFVYQDWKSLQVCYELLLQFLRLLAQTLESKGILKNYIDIKFASKLLERINSEDGREREYSKLALTQVYVLLIRLRTPIRRYAVR
mmetsp:Transcript_447/g.680  ORF Transcript_447/g.680 Transcript_447/m.680 type:complete len:210 (-) Transcript_447:1005-1634(-)